MKLGLGTAQFGMAYGVSNRDGQVGADEVGRIVARARELGVTLVDTAPAYGDAEERLGRWLEGERVVTKTLPDADVEATLLASLRRLKRERVYGLLVHHPGDLLGAPVQRALRSLKQRGLVEKVGVSVYNARELDAVLAVFEPEIVQVPLNALDQRLVRSGHLARLKRQGVEVHSRSVFLQGLLLMDPKALPPHFTPHRSRIAEYGDAVARTGMTPAQAALQAVLACPDVDCVIVGVCSRAQLDEVASAALEARPAAELLRFACEDESLIDPSRWPSPSAGA